MSENGLEETYVEPKDRVLDPSLISSTLLDRMPTPTGWRLLILPYRGSIRTMVRRKRLGYVCQIFWFSF